MANRYPGRFVLAALALAAWLASAPRMAAQTSGVVLQTATEQIQLKAYAEFMSAGVLRVTSGSLKDIPTIDNFRSFRTSLTGWRPVRVMVASEDLFKSEYAERRLVSIATRPIGVTALEVRVADLERPERIAELQKGVGIPEGGDRVYFFLVLSSDGIIRYYPFRMRTAAK